MTCTSHDPPPSMHELPFLVAILVGARRTGDELLRDLAEEWLDALGVEVRFDPDSPCIRPCSDPAHPVSSMAGNRPPTPVRGTP